MSSICSSAVGIWDKGSGSDMPVPRSSMRINREKDANRWW